MKKIDIKLFDYLTSKTKYDYESQAGACEQIATAFNEEYIDYRRIDVHRAAKKWLRSRPTCLGIVYNYSDITFVMRNLGHVHFSNAKINKLYWESLARCVVHIHNMWIYRSGHIIP